MKVPIALFIVVLLSAVPRAHAIGQSLSLASSAADSAPLPSTGERVTDVFIGRNVVGPYVLSWRGVESGTEMVSQNNRLLKRGADYNIDPGAGILTFVKPVKSGQMVRVDYRCIPGQTVRNTNSLVTPMELRLFQAGAMSMNAIFKPGTEKDGKTISAAGPNSLMLLNFGGATQVSDHSKLASKMFFDLQGGSLARKGALQL